MNVSDAIKNIGEITEKALEAVELQQIKNRVRHRRL